MGLREKGLSDLRFGGASMMRFGRKDRKIFVSQRQRNARLLSRQTPARAHPAPQGGTQTDAPRPFPPAPA